MMEWLLRIRRSSDAKFLFFFSIIWATCAGFIIGYFVGMQEPRDLTIGEKICAHYDEKHGYGVKK